MAQHDLLAVAWNEIREHGLESSVADLDAHGLTVIPPAKACPDGLEKRLLDAVLDVAERRNGVRPDLETGSTHAHHKGRFAALARGDGDSPIGDLMQSILFEHRVFEEALSPSSVRLDPSSAGTATPGMVRSTERHPGFASAFPSTWRGRTCAPRKT